MTTVITEFKELLDKREKDITYEEEVYAVLKSHIIYALGKWERYLLYKIPNYMLSDISQMLTQAGYQVHCSLIQIELFSEILIVFNK